MKQAAFPVLAVLDGRHARSFPGWLPERWIQI
jgi:hypothetical protein